MAFQGSEEQGKLGQGMSENPAPGGDGLGGHLRQSRSDAL